MKAHGVRSAQRARSLRKALDHLNLAIDVLQETFPDPHDSESLTEPLAQQYIRLFDLLGKCETELARSVFQDTLNEGTEVFVRDMNRWTKYETCPICKRPFVKVDYGHAAIVGKESDQSRCRAFWHCPDCGDSVVAIDRDTMPTKYGWRSRGTGGNHENTR